MVILIGTIVHSLSSTVDTPTLPVQAQIQVAGVQHLYIQTQRNITHGNIVMRMTTTLDLLDGTQDLDPAVVDQDLEVEVDITMAVDQAMAVDQTMAVDQDLAVDMGPKQFLERIAFSHSHTRVFCTTNVQQRTLEASPGVQPQLTHIWMLMNGTTAKPPHLLQAQDLPLELLTKLHTLHTDLIQVLEVTLMPMEMEMTLRILNTELWNVARTWQVKLLYGSQVLETQLVSFDVSKFYPSINMYSKFRTYISKLPQ